MNHTDAHNYRQYSSSWSGMAPRSSSQRWPSNPVSYEPTRMDRVVSGLKRLLALVHGQPDNLETK